MTEEKKRCKFGQRGHNDATEIYPELKMGRSGRENKETVKSLTFPLIASAVSDVDSDTSEHFEPESYLPSEGVTDEGSVGDKYERCNIACGFCRREVRKGNKKCSNNSS